MLQLACLVLAASFAVSSTLSASADQNPPQQGVPQVTLPQVVVTAQKEPADAQRLPVSVTAVNRQALDSAGFSSVGEASVFSPNTLFAELSARKVSNPFIRGIGSSPSSPGVTTYIDGVPQLNANSSNIELIDIEQIEFVRGAQSALYGRNTLGGLINVTTARPSMTQWTSRDRRPRSAPSASSGFAARCPGPLSGNAALGLAFGTRVRDGFTVNDVTGHTLDDRSATFGSAQFVYMPTPMGDALHLRRRARSRRRLRAERSRCDRAAIRSTCSAISKATPTATSVVHGPHPHEGQRSRSRRRPAAFVEDTATSPISITRRCRS